jgi:hypothetical protein
MNSNNEYLIYPGKQTWIWGKKIFLMGPTGNYIKEGSSSVFSHFCM